MDGISSASAVVALAVQLISTTRDVVKFFQEIQNSPDELLNALEFLRQFEGNLKEVENLIERQVSYMDLNSTAAISSDSRVCETKIQSFEQCVNKCKGVLDRKSPMRKTWASFKLVLKKGEIQNIKINSNLPEAT